MNPKNKCLRKREKGTDAIGKVKDEYFYGQCVMNLANFGPTWEEKQVRTIYISITKTW